MKAFRFRLDQVLRWRASQLDIAKARLASAVCHLTDLKRAEAVLITDLTTAAASRVSGIDGAELALLGHWESRTRREIEKLKLKQRDAGAAIQICRQAVVEADQRFRLLDSLKEKRRADWQSALNLELESFAAESFLSRQRAGSLMP